MPRTSNRVRKPSQRALEAGFTSAPHSRVAEIKEEARRKTASKPRQARATARKGKGKPTEKATVERPVLRTVLKEEDERAVCLLLELVSAALSPGFEPEVKVDLQARRRAFYAAFNFEN